MVKCLFYCTCHSCLLSLKTKHLWQLHNFANIFQVTELKTANDYVCEECIKHGDQWMHLRTCQTCGVTLCCDSSPNTHMTKHHHATQHPLVISAEPGERWLYCYADDAFAEY